ncbi:hypothetical protein SISSUDRAFT_976526 [Sistotremastrum suecicum HHB10207 ss-3]|uniref:Tethering factor for nuclear proteasome STS1 n=1 Tax=Sistotremastrum suecicum HHB10207 ss-3 TaxID=1314776 RepID=A0A166JAS0_9AGAM|nr:hypothetical protein SISSUDRAFT_976526 [Sistotremastrum suecicum HHB10207 ss-3]
MRSPTPERIRRAPPKRSRMDSSEGTSPAAAHDQEKSGKESKAVSDSNDVDLGVLLASLPQESLLPLLTSLIQAQPSLKQLVLSLMPRPTLEHALNALNQAAAKLKHAYPYSNSSPPVASTSFGFGGGGPRLSSSMSSTSSSHSHPQSQMGGSMRDSYVLSRIRPHLSEFMSTVMSYLPFFILSQPTPSTGQSLAAHREKVHPNETFRYLSHLTSTILSLQPLSQQSLAKDLFPRILQEWFAWVDRIDEYVNKEGGMFSSVVVEGWDQDLESLSNRATSGNGFERIREVRDKWRSKAGWLVRHMPQQLMMEEEEL